MKIIETINTNKSLIFIIIGIILFILIIIILININKINKSVDHVNININKIKEKLNGFNTSKEKINYTLNVSLPFFTKVILLLSLTKEILSDFFDTKASKRSLKKSISKVGKKKLIKLVK